jgi:hypothetical protein
MRIMRLRRVYFTIIISVIGLLGMQNCHSQTGTACTIGTSEVNNIKIELDQFQSELSANKILLYNYESNSFDALNLIVSHGELPYLRQLKSPLLDSLIYPAIFNCADTFMNNKEMEYVNERRQNFSLGFEQLEPMTMAKKVLSYINKRDIETDYFKYRLLAVLYVYSYESIDQWMALTNYFDRFKHQDSLLFSVNKGSELLYQSNPLTDTQYFELLNEIKRPTLVSLSFSDQIPYTDYLKIDRKKLLAPLVERREIIAQRLYKRPFTSLDKIEAIKAVYSELPFRIKERVENKE